MAETTSDRKAGYAAFTTFNNFIGELAEKPDMLPRRIDKSLMKGQSGGVQSQLLITLRFLGLVAGDEDSTTAELDDLVHRDEEGRKEWMAEAVRSSYPEAMELAAHAGTAAELAELFSELYGHKGSTRDKAIRFYLQMAEHAGVEVSPHFSVPRASPSGNKKKGTKKGAGKGAGDSSPPPAPSHPGASGDSYQVTLQGGGTVTVVVAESHFNLSKNRSDRDFVNGLVDNVIDYATEHGQEVLVDEEEAEDDRQHEEDDP